MKVKKAHVRTMLPVASAGFACLWAWFYLVMLSPFPANHSGAEASLLLKLVFLAGMVASMMLVYVKRDLFAYTERDPLPRAAALLTLPLGLFNIMAHYMAVSEIAHFIAWALAGGGFSLIFLLWPKVFMVGWQKDVGAYLSAGALVGAVLYLFACKLEAPYGDVALILLPLASLAVFQYVRTHIVGSEQEPEAALEQTKLFPLTGFTVAVFGALFGFALYLVCKRLDTLDPLVIAAAIGGGATLHLALSALVKLYIPFGFAERLSLLLLVAGFLGLAFLGPSLTLACCLFIVGAYVYLDFSNLAALVGFASGHPSPFWRIARGQLVLPLGMMASWAVCLAIDHSNPALLAYLPYGALGLLLALALLAAFVPFKDNTFVDKTVEAEVAEGGYFKQRCTQAAQTHKLSNREGEILYYLAKGRNAQFIAGELCISAYTAKTHVYHIYQKMGINSQQELISIIDSTETMYQ
ncbi:MAG: helix-turn-helix transcriptional regulator [Gordonibacter sp.]